MIERISSGHKLTGIGIGVPTPAGPASDRLVMAVNIPTMEGYPIRPMLSDRFDVPVVIENDANCMALGEYRAGALRGCSDCVCLTLGTGLGCGIVLNGGLFRGVSCCAGEIWNIPAVNGSLLEDTVSAQALRSLYSGYSGDDIDAREIHRRFLRGDIHAQTAFDKYGEAVGRVVVTVISMIDPEKIAIGGGLSGSIDAFHPGMDRVVCEAWGPDAVQRIVPAELSGSATLLGAAAALSGGRDS